MKTQADYRKLAEDCVRQRGSPSHVARYGPHVVAIRGQGGPRPRWIVNNQAARSDKHP
jgi:hypothetical protein